MDANQRSEVNNQTNNVANEKWTPGSKGKTADDGPLDHTYPQAAGEQQQGNKDVDTMGAQQTEMAGSGTVQGITDSHQRQMEPKSGAYGMLEQPVGHRPKDSGVNLSEQRDMQRDRQPDLQGGSLGSQHGNMQSNTQGGGMHGPQSQPTSLTAGSIGNRQQTSSLYVSDNSTRGGGMLGRQDGTQGNKQGGQEAQRGNTQLGVSGSHSMANQTSAVGGVHESNDAAGGLPRSPGNTGARNAAESTDRSGSQTGPGAADGGPPAHESNDAAGGYPRSPGYANRLAGDKNMDDDTGFKRKP
jgi:hypothetical protein